MSEAPGNVQYNYAQLEGIWTQAGGPAGAAPIAAAIAMAESGGNSTATNNDSNGSTDRGLWQINSVHGSQSTYDVMGNARAAVAISNQGTNWSPWTTYTSGAYRQYLQTNIPPDTSAPINGTNAQANQNTANLTGFQLPGGLYDPANWFLDPLGSGEQAAGNAFAAAGPTLIKFFMRGLIVAVLNPMIQLMAGMMGMAAGGLLVIVGFWMVARQTQTGQQVERGALWAGETGLSAVAPETKASTIYQSGGKETARVTQTRRQAGRVRVGGRNVQYRPGTVSTQVDRPEPDSTQQQLRNQSREYARGGETERTTTRRPYGYGQRMGPPRPVRPTGPRQGRPRG